MAVTSTRRAALDAAARRSWEPGQRDALRAALPGHGTEPAPADDVDQVAAITGREPRAVTRSGALRTANVARLRAALRRWACPPPNPTPPTPGPAENAEPEVVEDAAGDLWSTGGVTPPGTWRHLGPAHLHRLIGSPGPPCCPPTTDATPGRAR